MCSLSVQYKQKISLHLPHAEVFLHIAENSRIVNVSDQIPYHILNQIHYLLYERLVCHLGHEI